MSYQCSPRPGATLLQGEHKSIMAICTRHPSKGCITLQRMGRDVLGTFYDMSQFYHIGPCAVPPALHPYPSPDGQLETCTGCDCESNHLLSAHFCIRSNLFCSPFRRSFTGAVSSVPEGPSTSTDQQTQRLHCSSVLCKSQGDSCSPKQLEAVFGHAVVSRG